MRTMISLVLILIISISIQYNISAQEIKSLNKYKEYIVQSQTLKEDRTIWIYTPDGYNKTTEKKYPVIYVLDGYENFEYVVSTTKFLYDCNLMPQLLVVGVLNTNRDRDMLPTHLEKISESGGAEAFSKVLINEILPFVENNYRTLNYKLLYGHSYAGLFTQFMLTNYKNVFNAYIAPSPSVYWDNDFIVKMIANKNKAFEKNIYNYFSMGTNERDEMVNASNKLDSVFNQLLIKGLKYKYELMENEDHSTTRLKSIYNGLEFIFKEWSYPFNSSYTNWNLDSLNIYYDRLSEKLEIKIDPPESSYYYIGYYNISRDKKDLSINSFQEAVINYSYSPNSYIYLAGAYENFGDSKEAIKTYENALEKFTDDVAVTNNIKELMKALKQEVNNKK